MYTDMDLYAKVRRAVMVDAMSERAAARNFGISRKTVNKMANHTVPPGYQRKDRPVAPKLGAFVGIIDQILQDDRDVPGGPTLSCRQRPYRFQVDLPSGGDLLFCHHGDPVPVGGFNRSSQHWVVDWILDIHLRQC